MENLLTLTNISKSYQQGSAQNQVLKEVNLRIKKGEFCAIMGPSGSGKSTLMNIMGCLDQPTDGSYQIETKEISSLTDVELSDMRNKTIGFVFQNFHLLPKLTISQNVELPLVYAKVPKDIRKKKATNLLKEVGLLEKANAFPSELSGGQQQRIAIARALITDAPLILADEPTGALDTETGNQIMEILKQLNEQGKTIIVITHEIEIANQCKRIIVIRDGTIEQDRRE